MSSNMTSNIELDIWTWTGHKFHVCFAELILIQVVQLLGKLAQKKVVCDL